MNLPYSLRLVCLCLAAFFLVHLTVGLLLALLAPGVIRWARRLQASRAATLLFAMRLLPAVLGTLAVLLICIPSYLLLEPTGSAEEAGAFCLGCALLCLLLWGQSIARSVSAAARSIRYQRRCRRERHEAHFTGEPAPVWVVDDCSPGLALLGLFRPRFVISARLARVLSHEELSVALRHERAHSTAGDNFKRLLLLLTPDLFPFLGGFERLERGWNRFAEWAADDRAVDGDAGRSFSLAAALVRVARQDLDPAGSPLLSTFVSGPWDLAERVNRLLEVEPKPAPPIRRSVSLMAAGALFAAFALTAAVVTSPGALHESHWLLEALLR